ncbi:alanine racemase [Nesterenkonia sp. F]|uniref:alanine racemase n=1 Tax=Nesterenkonia sp. F TaxID=795955 RepID=UPI000255D15B|nr:alanine racemase [Nesterenkonia sp. F]
MADSPRLIDPIDRERVDEISDEVLGWRHHAVPRAFHGLTARELAEERPALGRLQTPVMTLDAGRLQGNGERFAAWCSRHGVDWAPHGKTTMAPQLWAQQLAHGAWGITLANAPQLRVARQHGVRRVMVANVLTDPGAIGEAAQDVLDGAEIVSWVDSERAVARLEAVLAEFPEAVLDIVVELGAPGGRTGARTDDEAVAIARAVAAAPQLRLVGVGGYEGALAHTGDAAALTIVRGYLERVGMLHDQLDAEALYAADEVMITAGGSAFFDDVVDVLAERVREAGGGRPAVRVVLRSGACIIHDDGFYRGISPLGRTDPDGPGALRSAMHCWARVVSQPEPGLAILDAGKRDVPVDEGLPAPQLIGPRLGGPMTELRDAAITAVNDQHCFLVVDPDQEISPGDVVRLGLSHPCTALDKWQLLPVLDDADSPQDARVVSTVRTCF